MMATDARPTRETRMNRLGCSIAVVHILFFAPFASAAETVDCHVGIYRMSDGRTVDIAPTDGDTLRWRRFDGSTGLLTRTADGLWTSTFGWTGRPDGRSARFSGCAGWRITFDGLAGHRLDLHVRETTFTSHGVTLAGRLLLQKGSAAVPVVGLVSRAEHEPA